MKICFITYDIFTIGGIQRVVTILANSLSKYHDVEIISTSKKCKVDRSLYNLDSKVQVKLKGDLKNLNFFVRVYSKFFREINRKTNLLNKKKFLNFLTNIYFNSRVRKQYTNYLNSQNYDVIIGVSGGASLILGTIANNLKAKTIGWQHNSYDAFFNNKYRYLYHQDLLFNEYIQRLDKYVVLTEYDKEKLLVNKNIESIAICNARSFNSKEKSPLSEKIFLAAGRFNYQKGFDLLIESFNEFSKKDNEWKLIIIGDGDEMKKVQAMIKKYGLEDRVSLPGFSKNIKKYFLQSSVLLLSSRWEGMPMIVLESLEMGVPIIAYDITAAMSLIDNDKEGILVSKYDTNKFADAMFELSKSEEKRRELSENAIKRSKKYDIEEITKRWNDLFEEIT